MWTSLYYQIGWCCNGFLGYYVQRFDLNFCIFYLKFVKENRVSLSPCRDFWIFYWWYFKRWGVLGLDRYVTSMLLYDIRFTFEETDISVSSKKIHLFVKRGVSKYSRNCFHWPSDDGINQYRSNISLLWNVKHWEVE